MFEEGGFDTYGEADFADSQFDESLASIDTVDDLGVWSYDKRTALSTAVDHGNMDSKEVKLGIPALVQKIISQYPGHNYDVSQLAKRLQDNDYRDNMERKLGLYISVEQSRSADIIPPIPTQQYSNEQSPSFFGLPSDTSSFDAQWDADSNELNGSVPNLLSNDSILTDWNSDEIYEQAPEDSLLTMDFDMMPADLDDNTESDPQLSNLTRLISAEKQRVTAVFMHLLDSVIAKYPMLRKTDMFTLSGVGSSSVFTLDYSPDLQRFLDEMNTAVSKKGIIFSYTITGYQSASTFGTTTKYKNLLVQKKNYEQKLARKNIPTVSYDNAGYSTLADQQKTYDRQKKAVRNDYGINGSNNSYIENGDIVIPADYDDILDGPIYYSSSRLGRKVRPLTARERGHARSEGQQKIRDMYKSISMSQRHENPRNLIQKQGDAFRARMNSGNNIHVKRGPHSRIVQNDSRARANGV